MSDTQGRFCWYELNTSDVSKAMAFYKNVIGWETQAFDANYAMWTASGTPVGGVMTCSDEQKKLGMAPHWLSYVAADDVDALTKKAESLGAKTCVPPTDIPTIGRFSVIADPQGAVLALITPIEPERPHPPQPKSRYVCWHELMAGDRESALDFYSKLFGWQKTDAVESPMGTYQMYGKGGATFGGMATKPEGYPYPPHWLYYVDVEDLDAALARAKKSGGSVMHGPMEIPGGNRVAQCKDPQGAMFALHGK